MTAEIQKNEAIQSLESINLPRIPGELISPFLGY